MGKQSISPGSKPGLNGPKKKPLRPIKLTGASPVPKRFSKVKADASPCPVVGVGASAGGLEAFSKLLKSLPAKTGMALVFVQHLDPKRESQLAAILSRETAMPVREAKDGMKIAPDQVYIIPPNASMEISGDRLRIQPRGDGSGQHMPVDQFFSSLAKSRQNKAIGVVLSGTASDGSIGLKMIKANGGITFAEDEASAKYGGMPRNAIATDCVDFILTPEGIAAELARIAKHPFLKVKPGASADGVEETGDGIKSIFMMLRSATGVDFSQYRKSTLNRRIQRRMILHKVDDVGDYVAHLKKYPDDVHALYQDILIHVTGFFREPESFKALEDQVYPKLVHGRQSPGDPIRVWLPGCSTGEEAYSLAISLVEFLGLRAGETRIQIFGTDVSEQVIEKARQGIYPEDIESEVSPERLRRFFTKVERGYQINKSVREMCVFARQNVIKDPPFSKLDLISCRNLLIYLEPALQKKLMPVFHYALNPEGYLLLGSAETVGAFDEIFRLVDQKHKIYKKKPGTPRIAFTPAAFEYGDVTHEIRRKPVAVTESWSRLDVLKEADRALMSRYCPPAIVVDENMEIVQFRGQINPFIEPAAGEASLSLYKMVREGFQMELRTAIQRAKQSKVGVRKEGMVIHAGGHEKNINLEVIAISAPPLRERCFIITFEEIPLVPESLPKAGKTGKKDDPRVAQLEQELSAMKEHLQAVVEEQEATNEELRSANEEIQSSNEELQSTNEELETAKEELQSTNEELTTVNEELRHANTELTEVNNDLGNLLRSVNLPIIMLDRELRIRRFTPAAQKTMKLLPADIGRSITDLRPDLNLPDLEKMIREVIDNLSTNEREVQDAAGRWYSLQLRPYETSDNKIAGVVMVLFDIDARKRNAQLMKLAVDYADAFVETVSDPLLILDRDMRVRKATRGFYEMFHVEPEETEGKSFYELGNGQWDIPKLRDLLEKVLPKNSHVRDFKVEGTFPGIGRHKMLITAHRVARAGADDRMILLSIREAGK